ncbi:hypothetical protein [Hymenobacter jeollabukensis]|uniref:Uncharacterized protein n=1 Tax=Hymenobacter jeollabukensis TaxID=2025313 RepID=A0A5R8WKE3_9BACT|nr:hypothetical protein [Hymenobacter jeollabukensis]TLM89144.1 hypothetical protein FDY95_21475 [Hymenobacter jeollabukensis]
MNTFVRPVNNSVSTAQLVPAPALTPERPASAATAPVPQRTHAQLATESEADDQTKRDFYAWCAGCEGYGSIF